MFFLLVVDQSCLSIDLHVVVHLGIQLISSLGLASFALGATTTTATATTTTRTTTAGALGTLLSLVLAVAVAVAGRSSWGMCRGEDGLGGSRCQNDLNLHGLAIQRNSVELAVSNGGITDAGEVDNSSSVRLSVLVVHESALLERSDSGGEDELQVFGGDTVVEVGDLHLGAIGNALADDGGVKGCDGSGTVLLDASLVRSVVATLADVAGRAGGTGTTRTAGGGVVAGAAGLAGLDDIIKGHIEGAGHGVVVVAVVGNWDKRAWRMASYSEMGGGGDVRE